MKKIIVTFVMAMFLAPIAALSQYSKRTQDDEKVFKESFDNNDNNWDLYTSDLSSAEIVDGALVLQSFQERGTSRYKILDQSFDEFSAEVKILQQQNTIKKNKVSSAGLMFGFKDWDNYWYFNIVDSYFEIGQVIEGIINRKANMEYTSYINQKSENLIKVIGTEQKMIFSINGEVVFQFRRQFVNGTGVGMAIAGMGSKCIFDDLIVKDFTNGFGNGGGSNANVKSSGSGLILSEKGIIVTNYHVVEGAKKITISTTVNGIAKDYIGSVLVTDKENDLALVQITDTTFSKFPTIPYGFRTTGGYDLGSSIYTIGFPLALSGMGTDPKFSDGKISAKSGYEGSANGFQTTIPVQPGNSGGPVFNSKAELIGIINSKIFEADNVSYGIKSLYLTALGESASPSIEMPMANMLSDLSLEEQLKILTEFVVLIKIS